MDKIEQLMALGWNIHLECKGKGREYEMTYEATATKVWTGEEGDESFILSFYPIHAVGDTIDEIAENLAIAIYQKEEQNQDNQLVLPL